MEKLEAKIDKIAEDTQYMRGYVEEAIPRLQEDSKIHSQEISNLKIAQGNIKTKVGIFSAIIGAIGAGIINLFAGHGHL